MEPSGSWCTVIPSPHREVTLKEQTMITPIHPDDVELARRAVDCCVDGTELARVANDKSFTRRTLGKQIPTRRTLGKRVPTRRTLGRRLPTRRTLGRRVPTRRAL